MGAVTGMSGLNLSGPNIGNAAVGSTLGGQAMGPAGSFAGGVGGLMGQLPTNLGGGIGAMTGTAGGASGTGFAKPQLAPVINPTTPDGVAAAQQGATNSLGGSAGLLAALQGQNAPATQTAMLGQGNTLAGQLAGNNGAGIEGSAAGQQAGLNAGLGGLNGAGTMGAATGMQGALAGQLGGAGGIGAQTGAIGGLQNVLAQQQGTAGQLQGIANGTGPNPAQAMLNQATGQNVANQAALMAGQRGAGANVGLMARQAAQQGAGIQQNAAGQGATMQAQQQMNAIGQLGAQQQAMGATNQNIAGIGSALTGQQQAAIGQLYGQGAGATGMQQTGINSLAGQGGAMVGQQTAQLGQNAGVAQNMVGNQISATGQNVQGNLTNAGQQLGAVQGVNNAAVSAQSSVNTGNTALAGGVQKQESDLIGGMLGAGGKGAQIATSGGAAAARGGEVHMAGGGVPIPMVQAPQVGASSSFGQFLMDPSTNPEDSLLKRGASTFASGVGGYINKRMNAPEEGGIAGGDSSDVGSIAVTAARGGEARDFRGGGGVNATDPDERATKAGNSYANDKIPAMLSEGEVVIPRSVMSSPDPASAAAKFVAALKSKKGGGKKMADGGEALDPESPEPAVDTPAAAPEAAPAPDPTAPPAAAPQAPQDPNAPIDVDGHDMDNQDALVAADIARGQIHPKTIESLYAKKDTLGKIGTLFGLLVSGAGAGLTHQPNAVLESMQKQIANDLEAQQNSNTNAQNWLRLTQAHQMNKAQRKLLGAQTESTKAGTAKIDADTDLVASTAATNWMRLGALNNLQGLIAKMPPGHSRDVAQHMLDNVVAPGVASSNKANNAKTNAVLKTRAAINGAAGNGEKPEPSPIDFDKLDQLEKQGRFAGDLGAGMPSQDIASARAEADKVVTNRKMYGTWKKAFTQLDNMALGGKLTSQTRNAIVTSLASQMAKQSGIPTNAEQLKLVDSMFPSAEDWAGARQAKIDYTTEHFKQMEGGTPTLTQYKLIRPFPAPPTVAKNKTGSVGGAISAVLGGGKSESAVAKESGPKDGTKQKSKSGRPMTWRNGGWKYDK